ncbi:unnamed protein product [Oppiella nova]|uniref:Uncharacterized protein n=1 Tax=Oppiella nova TaxID=334625 RepID=A0A7R9LHK2_9ACAR|nr:unnamed protein product [Oppiella nova]CAG2163017.1 unnamed protein product [Oppiella nova]
MSSPVDSMFSELNQRYQKKLRVSAVDVDIFANCVTRVEQLEELQHLVYQLRRSKETVNTLESTHHAFCRVFLKFRQTDRLLHILSDRIGFGIFADLFSYNMLLDHLIDEKNWRAAARVAALMMAQEDCGNGISQRLALYSVHKYLREENRSEWFESEELERLAKEDELYPNACTDRAVITTDDNDEEVQYIRVPYLRNKWFDDHFDIRDANHLCGKTLYFFSKQFDDIVGRSQQIIGLILYEKWDKCLKLLTSFQKLKQNVVKDVVKTVDESIEKLTDESTHKQILLDIKKVLDVMDNDSQIVDKDLDELVSQKLSEIKELEIKDTEIMPQIFKEWEKDRELALNKQMEDLLKEERRKQLDDKKSEMQEKHRIMYFFENFAKHEMDFVAAEQKIAELKSKTVVDEDYIPPEIR